MAITTQAVDQLRDQIRGDLIGPDDDRYEDARRVHNFMIDRKPAMVARCADTADVLAAVRFGRDAGIPIALRGGGHSVPGFGTVDDGIVIDLGPMRWVHVDPERRTAWVGGGATWGDIDHATHPFGLATPGGVISTTGVSGLTLGGGIGHLSRRFGLSCDNLISADVVTADGRLVTASEREHDDLYWALRGGSGNFGVVTAMEFRLHPVDTVLAGPVLFDLDRTADVIRLSDELITGAPEELGAFFAFQIGPPADFVPAELQGVTMCGVVACWSGSVEEGEKVLEPLRRFGPPLIDAVHVAPYPAVQCAFDGLVPRGLQHYWKASFLDEVTDGVIAAHVEHGPKVPAVSSTMHQYPINGAVQRVGKTETAFWHRDARYSPVIAGMWPDPADNEANIAWVRDYYAALAPHSREGAYVNFLDADDSSRLRAVYGDNWDRLVEVKRAWDPDNVFHVNQNIVPGG